MPIAVRVVALANVITVMVKALSNVFTVMVKDIHIELLETQRFRIIKFKQFSCILDDILNLNQIKAATQTMHASEHLVNIIPTL